MRFFLAGLNHKTAPVEVREKVAFDEASLANALADLRKQPGMHEGMILSTCNRVEVAVTAEDGADAEGAVENFISASRSIDRSWVTPYLYRHNGEDAIRHVFRVASSLDSMVVGEPQILGQLKSAYAVAKECGSVHGDLDLVIAERDRLRGQGMLAGLGIAACLEPSGGNSSFEPLLNPVNTTTTWMESCRVNVDAVGAITATIHTTSSGQGHETLAATAIAEARRWTRSAIARRPSGPCQQA